MTMTATTAPTGFVTKRVLVRCRTCKHTGWTEAIASYSNGSPLPAREVIQNAFRAAWAVREACVNHRITAHLIEGTVNPEKACGARCVGAVGPACSCECGGENHGGKYGTW